MEGNSRLRRFGLIGNIVKRNGRNNIGRITVFHRGGGVKRRYRVIDFYREKCFMDAIVLRKDYDPNRNCRILLVRYLDGNERYVLNVEGLNKGSVIRNNVIGEGKEGDWIRINRVGIGNKICCVESYPGSGAKIARSAGVYVRIVRKDIRFNWIRLSSGKEKGINNRCFCVLGNIGDKDRKFRKIGKAGINRLRGIRPTVRGVAMNPIDHPHGGGEGKTSTKRHPVTPWGRLTKGKKTRNR